jgi:hypothetical protein
MQEAGVSLLTNWQNFYVIIGAAAATLTGLMFVAITVIAGLPVRASSMRATITAFGTPTVVHFCTALLVAVILSVPWQALWNAALLLGLVGLVEVSYIGVIVVRRVLRQTDYEPRRVDWLWYVAIPLAAYAALVAAAVLLPGNPAPALLVTGGVTVLLLFTGIRNAWDSVTYVAIERSHPEEEEEL